MRSILVPLVAASVGPGAMDRAGVTLYGTRSMCARRLDADRGVGRAQ